MTKVSRIKTYCNTKKVVKDHPSTTSQNSLLFPVSGASSVIDSLIAKNIEKRNSSYKEVEGNEIENNKKLSGKEYSSLFYNDSSLDVKINTTFENLLKGPHYNSVKFCNVSAVCGNSSTDNSSIKYGKKLAVVEELPVYNIRPKLKRNYAKFNVNGKSKSIIKGKVAKKKNKKRVVQVKITDTNENNDSKILSNKLDDVSNGLNFSAARKFTPIASNSNVSNQNHIKNQSVVFQPGVRHCMRAQNSSNYMIASTPLVPRNIEVSDDLTISPITAKIRLNFNSDWKSMFDSEKTESSLPSTSNKNNTNLIIINSTCNENVLSNNFKSSLVNLNDSSYNFKIGNKNDKDFIKQIALKTDNLKKYNQNKSNVKNDFKFNAIPLVQLSDVDGYRSHNINKKSAAKTVSKLNMKAVVNITRYTKYLNNPNNSNKISRSRSQSELFNYSSNISNSSNYVKKNRSKSVGVETVKITKINKTKRNTKRRIIPSPSKIVTRNKLKKVAQSKRSNSQSTSENTKEILTKQKLNSKAINYSGIAKRTRSRFDPITTTTTTKNNSFKNDECEKSQININKSTESVFINSTANNIENKMTLRTRIKSTPENYNNDNIYSRKYKRLVNNNSVKKKIKSTEPNSTIIRKSQLKTENIRKSKRQSSVYTINDSDSTLNITNHSDKVNNSNLTGISENSIRSAIVNASKLRFNLDTWEEFSRKTISAINIDCSSNEHCKTTNNCEPEDICNTLKSQLNRPSILLKPGKQWVRSLSILRQSNLRDLMLKENFNKGRKWRESVYSIIDQQKHQTGALNASGNQYNDIYNKPKILPRIKNFQRRTTLQIVPQLQEYSVKCNVISILEEAEVTNKTGYVATFADESESILGGFDKLSLTANVDEREETARQIILKRCGQTAPILFDDCYSQRILKKCRKIGEGVYGEVFMYQSSPKECRVMKVIPIEGNLVVNGEHQKKFEEIISEIFIASELSNLRTNKEFCTNGFNELLKICCVQGKYPQHLLDLWNIYDEEQGSENDSPEIFTNDQLYIVLELANGGEDLEAYRFNNAEQAHAVFVQVACSLAIAESALQFEHRDMHWGNILITATDEPTTTFRLNGRELEVATKGVQVSIIDFTLSRMTFNKCCIFNDLSLDPELFTATGDYQFDIYRLMRERNHDDWQRFEPYTNILWLDYTLEKMITQLRYLRIKTKTHKTYIRRLSQLRKKILDFNSATEFINSDVFSQVFLY